MIPDRGERYQTSRIWALLVAEPTREWTEHMLPMWSDLGQWRGLHLRQCTSLSSTSEALICCS